MNLVKHIKAIWTYMQGNRMLYLGAILSVGLAAFFTLLGPLVIRITIDSIIGSEPMDVPAWLEHAILRLGSLEQLRSQLWIPGIALMVLAVLRGLFLFLRGKLSAQAAESMAKGLRERLYDHLQHLTYAYHTQIETGDLIQRCTSDLENLRRFLAMQFVEVGNAIFMIALVLAIMLRLHVPMTMVAMAVVPIIFFFAFFFFLKIRDAFRISDEAEASMSTMLQENLTGVRVVRAFANESHEVEKFEKVNSHYRDVTYRLIKLNAVYWSLSDLLCLFQIGLVLVVGVFWTANGVITLGTLVVFTTYEGMLLWPVRHLGRILTDMGKTFVAVERMEEILAEPREVMSERGDKPPMDGPIAFRSVHFSYDDAPTVPVLEDISFDVEPGETVAVLGHTGSGKSSLVHLLARLYEYTAGTITIGGRELKSIDRSWVRQNVGLVMQEPFLFARSIGENIALAKPNATQDEVEAAAKAAAVHDVILEFDKGYDTIVGERGVSLSGGQRQRVAIARTLLSNHPILVFDDSLSAVDTETDAAIRHALSHRAKDRTTFIITHRIASILDADRILVLDHGRIVQQGTHDELVNQPGLYRRTWEIQSAVKEDTPA